MILLALIIDVHAAGYFKNNLNDRFKQGDLLGFTKLSYLYYASKLSFSTPRVKYEQINRRRKLMPLSNRGLSTESLTLAQFLILDLLGQSIGLQRITRSKNVWFPITPPFV